MPWSCKTRQVVRPGAIDPSVIDAEGDREAIGRVRKRVWGMTAVGYFAVFVMWPVFTVRPGYIPRDPSCAVTDIHACGACVGVDLRKL